MAIDFNQFKDKNNEAPAKQSSSVLSPSGFDFTQFKDTEPTISEQVGQQVSAGIPPSVAMVESVGKRMVTQQTPEELVAEGFNPVEAGLMASAQQIVSPIISFGDVLGAGLADVAAKKLGTEIEGPSDIQLSFTGKGGVTIPKGALEVPAEIAGFVRGGAMKVGTAISKNLVKGATLGKDMLRGAIQLGIASGLNTPEDEFENWQGRITRGAYGAAGGAMFGGASNRLNKLKEVVSKEERIAKAVRGKIGAKQAQPSQTFENSLYQEALKTNTQKTDVGKAFSRVNTEMRNTINEFSKKHPDTVGKVLNGEAVSLTQFQKAYNTIKDTFSKTKQAGKGLKSKDQDVKKLLDKMQKYKHDTFKGSKDIDKTYGEMSEKLKLFENLKLGKTMGTMRSTLKDKEASRTLKELVGPKLFKQVESFVKAEKLGKKGAALVETFIKYGIIYTLLQKSFKKATQGLEPDFGDPQ